VSKYSYSASLHVSTHLLYTFYEKGILQGWIRTLQLGMECAPCAGSNLTLKEKLISLDDMELEEENKDDSPSTDDEESVA
jgi:hypothetical protein